MRIGPANGWLTLGLIAVFTSGIATDVSAGPTRVIRFDEGDSFFNAGAIWEVERLDADLSGNFAPKTVNMLEFPKFPPDTTTNPPDVINYPQDGLGFGIDYGDGLKTEMHIFQEGYVSFGALGDPAVGPPGVDASGPLDNVATPLYLNDGFVPSEIQWAQGLLDLNGGPPFSVDDAVKALRVTWTLNTADGAFPFQIVLLDMSGLKDAGGNVIGKAGDFDMEFNYQNFIDGAQAPAGALKTAGFLFNLVSPTFDWTTTAEGSQTFLFRGGVFQGSLEPPITVPEPNPLLLILTGLLLLLAAGVYRRRVAVHPAR